MYDKILCHRQTIEAHLGASEDDQNGGRDHGRASLLFFDDEACNILVAAENDEAVRRASQIISHFLPPDEKEDYLGLADLTSESLLAKMASSTSSEEQQQQPPAAAAASAVLPKHPKIPLGNASSWDAATRTRHPIYGGQQQPPYSLDEATRLLMRSSLPPELGLKAETWLQVPKNQSIHHTSVTRTASDSYVQFMPNVNHADVGKYTVMTSSTTTTDSNNRRKLESEDSSYGSDHENQDLTARRPKPSIGGGMWPHSKSHDDVSRTTSETLGAEFAEYVNNSGEDYETLEALLQDKDYDNKVMFALRLGYSEKQLQRAVLKIGRRAGQNQILEELIRLQKSSKSSVEEPSQVNEVENNLVNESILKLVEMPVSKEEVKGNNSNGLDTFLPIVIDGSNVAMSHGNKERFSCKGIKICVDWFLNRGHKDITVFVPLWRKESSKPETPITGKTTRTTFIQEHFHHDFLFSDQMILTDLEKESLLSFTPSRQVLGRRFVCHDDRYVLNLAADTGAIVVSNDNYRDLINEKPKYKEVIEERILMYSFVNDR
jgi:hypothetical protein